MTNDDEIKKPKVNNARRRPLVSRSVATGTCAWHAGVKFAAADVGGRRSHIGLCLAGKRRTAYGHTWRYATSHEAASCRLWRLQVTVDDHAEITGALADAVFARVDRYGAFLAAFDGVVTLDVEVLTPSLAMAFAAVSSQLHASGLRCQFSSVSNPVTDT